jgi:hypothetical protein
MKKYVFCLILVLSLNLSGQAQTVNQLLNKVSETENIEKVKIGGFIMSIGKMFGGVSNMPVARGVNMLEVYDLSGCNIGFKEELAQQFKNLKDGDGYETLLQAKEKNDGVRIMIKKEKNLIKEMVLLCMNGSDPAVIRIAGKIKEKDIEELVSQYK